MEEIAEFWQKHDAILKLDHENCLVNELGDSHANVVGFSDAEDTSDEETGSLVDRDVPGPLSRHAIKRPCELRNELIATQDTSGE